MVTVIKKGSDRKEIEKALSNVKNKKKFDAFKYCGAEIGGRSIGDTKKNER